MTPIMLFAAYAVVLVVALYIFVYIPNKKKQRQMKELQECMPREPFLLQRLAALN